MVYENNLPPIENKKPFETVYELKETDYEIKTSKLSLAARSKIIKKHGSDYLSERAFINDIALMEMYGPGFWDELNRGNVGKAFDEISDQIGPAVLETTKFVGKVAGGIVIGGTIAATGPFAIPLGAAVAAEGYFIKKATEQSDNEAVRTIGGFAGDTVMGGGLGGVSSAVMGAASSSLASKGANLALNSYLSNGSEELLRVWFYTRSTQMGYHLGSKTKQALEGFASFYHGTHKGKGVDYERECPICNGNFDKYFWL